MWAGQVVCEGQWRNEAGPGGRRSLAMWRIGRPSDAGAGLEEWLWRAMASVEGNWVWMERLVRRRWSCIREVEECRGCFQMLHTTEGQDRTGQGRREVAATVQRERTQDKERKGGRRQKRERGQMKQENQQRPTSPSYVLISVYEQGTH